MHSGELKLSHREVIHHLKNLAHQAIKILSLAAACTLCVCAQPPLQRFHQTHAAMGTIFTIDLNVTDQATAEQDMDLAFEEIDRLSIGVEGTASLLSSIATVDFYRGVPPGGYTKGLPAHLRSDKGEGDIPPEVRGTHFFGYKPYHLAGAPPFVEGSIGPTGFSEM